MSKLIITLFVGSLLLIPLGSCSEVQNILNIQKPTASLKGFSFGDVSLDAATLLFDVEVKNPYPVDMPLLDMKYQLNSNGNKLFDGITQAAGSIAAKDSKVIPIEANISYLDLVKALKDVRPGSVIPYDANVELNVDAPGLGVVPIPIGKKGKVQVPDIPNTKDVNWGDLLQKVTD